jgi:hypothetical protein
MDVLSRGESWTETDDERSVADIGPQIAAKMASIRTWVSRCLVS